MVLGLPDGVRACLFDLDGVLTDTAAVHTKAWKHTFDDFLQQRDGESFTPFDSDSDYNDYVDGKPRADGVRDFLASRDIHLPEGSPDDPPDAQTVNGVGNRKNEELLKRVEQDGVTVFDGSRRYLQAAKEAGLHRVCVSSSANARQVLEVTGLDALIEFRVDGVTIRERKLAGKPAPDTFLEAARQLGLGPEQAAIFEDAVAGVQAGAAGGFVGVIGVNRISAQHATALADDGATRVVDDLAELLETGDV